MIECKGNLTNMLEEKISTGQAEIYLSVCWSKVGKRRADILTATSHIRELSMVLEVEFRDGDGSCTISNG